jgi:hypothetical protein
MEEFVVEIKLFGKDHKDGAAAAEWREGACWKSKSW